MAWFENTPEEERLLRLENKATEIRKLLLGALLMAKGIWKDDLGGTPEGLEVLRAAEEAEGDFIAFVSIKLNKGISLKVIAAPE